MNRTEAIPVTSSSATPYTAVFTPMPGAPPAECNAAEILAWFARKFLVLDEKGQPVADLEAGGPLFNDAFYAVLERVLFLYTESTLQEVMPRLEANQYVSDDERARDSDLKVAVGIIRDDLRTLDNAARKRRLSEVRRAGEREFWKEVVNRTFGQVDKIVEDLRRSGVITARWPLDCPAPANSLSTFRRAVGRALESGLRADSKVSAQMLQLECDYLESPTRETIQARIAAYEAFLTDRDGSGETFLFRVVAKLVKDGWAA